MKVIGIVGTRRRDTPEDFAAVNTAFWRIYEDGDTLVSGGCPQGGDRFAELIALFLLYGGMKKDAERSLALTMPYWTLTRAQRHEYLSKANPSPIKLHLAQWDKYGKGAGFMRNGYIAADADLLIACVAADRTGGTEDTIRKFLAHKPADKLILV